MSHRIAMRTTLATVLAGLAGPVLAAANASAIDPQTFGTAVEPLAASVGTPVSAAAVLVGASAVLLLSRGCLRLLSQRGPGPQVDE